MGPLPPALHAVLVGVLVLAAAVWVGGFVTLVVVAGVARRVLGDAERVRFFRALGRAYGLVSGAALLLGLGAGGALLLGRPWDALLTGAVVVATLLVAATAAGVAQARRMTRLRHRALAQPGDAATVQRIDRGARQARLLRAGIGGLSLALVALGVLLAA